MPHGSVLGPKLFILYSNDLVKVSKELKYTLFADDTTLFYSGTELGQGLAMVENEKLNWKSPINFTKNISKSIGSVTQSKGGTE